ncbi:MAG TPA: CaiB/BaiF CoA-transferase family protein [Steroidobacteraceae bacterium]|nr:CaiB/BaiF CoA-transferase family protein [Steroidobacteraceae bacterium]
MGPLHGIAVLDLSRILAGPWASQALADFGASVIKIERPGTGDDTRSWGPPYLKGPDGSDTNESAYFASANRGKQSIAVDFSTPAGRDIVRRLAARSDVLLENFKVGGLARMGLGYGDLAPLSPRLIYCSISAFGQSGPLADAPGYDAMIQGMGGLMSLTGLPDGEPGAGPQKTGLAVSDLMAGMYALAAILGALYERERSGVGQFIDIALLDAQVAWLANQGLNYLATGRAPQRHGNAHPNIVPYQSFVTADGYLMLAVGNDRQFATFCRVAEREDLALDARFATNALRVANRNILLALLEPLLRSRPTQAWLAALDTAGVPCGPINDLEQVFAEPQVVHRAMRIDLPHTAAGQAPGIRNPTLYSRTSLEYEAAPPVLGEHTDGVLAEQLGFSPAELRQLRRDGVIG